MRSEVWGPFGLNVLLLSGLTVGTLIYVWVGVYFNGQSFILYFNTNIVKVVPILLSIFILLKH